MKRKVARELLMQMLYEMSIHNDFGEKIKERYIAQHEIPQSQQAYVNEACGIIREKKEKIDARINSVVTAWSVETMGKVEVAIMRLAICEILYMDSIPASVSINEAVELAKKFGEERSYKLINGALASLLRDKNEGKTILSGD